MTHCTMSGHSTPELHHAPNKFYFSSLQSLTAGLTAVDMALEAVIIAVMAPTTNFICLSMLISGATASRNDWNK